jgi:sulfonate transport system substrate-binding protein
MVVTASLTRRAALASLAAAAGCARSGKQAGKTSTILRIGTFKNGVQDLIGPAGEAHTPYAIAWSDFASGNLIAEAILAGALDAGSMSDIPPVFIAGAKPALKLVAVIKGDVNNQVVLVPKTSTILSLAELKGKRIGYVKATTSHYILLKLLEEQGLRWSDITPVALSPQDGRAAFERGSLDAWVIYGPSGQLARQAVGARILTTGLGRLSGNYVIAASDAALADPARAAALGDYLARLKRVYAWTESHPDDWARISAKATGLPAALYLEQRRERSGPTSLVPVDAAAIASQQRIADTFAQAGLIPSHVDVAPLWDSRFKTVLS